MRGLSDWIARLTVFRPVLSLSAALLLALGSFAIVKTWGGFDSDVLNLLPADYPAVEGLRIYNSRFAQTRELTFVLNWSKPPEDPNSILEQFTNLLKCEPWVVRVLEGSPLESQTESHTIQEAILPLLLNLPPDQFQSAMDSLVPSVIRERIARLAAQTAAGSPQAQMELSQDPLGLVTQAVKPVWETIALSDTFDLASPDETTYIVLVATNQATPSAKDSSETMAKVREFLARAKKAIGPDAPSFLVTGQPAYVDEISRSMGRDLGLTSSVSLIAVILLFWMGFRRLFPLLGIALILSLAGFVTLAFGMLIFGKLNVIAIAFCSILFGLGDDFSMLLCQEYFKNRNAGMTRELAISNTICHVAPGIFWVVLTTGLGFLALWFSGSTGFSQLGTLVAAGVLICAGLMMVLIFLFLRNSPPIASTFGPAMVLAKYSYYSPHRILLPAIVLIVGMIFISLVPWRPPAFDLSPSSLEPKNTPAAQALNLIMKKFPASFEPVLVVISAPTSEKIVALDTALQKVKATGLVQSSSSPSALVLDTTRMKKNSSLLQNIDFISAQAAMEESAQQAGISPNALKSAQTMLARLQKISSDPATNWSDFISLSSPWWFILDHMISPDASAAIAYLRVKPGITSEERRQLSNEIVKYVPNALVTGWTQTLASLVPWAQSELAIFGAIVAIVILTLLFIAYRDVRYWAFHVLSLIASAAGIIVTLKFTGSKLNLLNILAFPLILGVGVDYGAHLIFAASRSGGEPCDMPTSFMENISNVIKPVTLSGLTTITGFGALMLAQNPALSGLGLVCATGVAWCLISSLFLIVPGSALIARLAISKGKPA